MRTEKHKAWSARMNLLPWNVLLMTALLLGACAPSAEPVASTATAPAGNGDGQAIVLGEISDDIANTTATFQSFADHLAAQLGAYGYDVGEVKAAPDMQTMAQWLANGEVDLFFDSPYPAMRVIELSGATPILRRWKGGVEEYSSTIFTARSSGIAGLEDLRGRVIAFESEYSTSGYFLAAATLIQAGLELVPVSGPNAPVPDEKVGYFFTGDDENTAQLVLTGKVAAGAVNSLFYGEDLPPNTRTTLLVLIETSKVPRQLVIARPGLQPDLLRKLQTIMIDLENSEEGRQVLEGFEETTRFDLFDATSDLQRLKTLYELVSR